MARSPLLAILTTLCLTTSGCVSGVNYGIWSWLRGTPDYEEVAESRGAFDGTTQADPELPTSYWTEYRGPGGRGFYDETPLDLEWSAEGPPRLWSVPVGVAYSSVVVGQGLVVTLEQRGDREAAVAFALADGAPVWEHTWPARFYESMSKEGPRSTPVIANGRVVVAGATGALRCLDLATGQLQWAHELLQREGSENLFYGLSASPRVEGDVVFAVGARSIHAFELDSGEERWKALDEPTSYSSPQLTDVLGKRTLVLPTASRVVGVDPDDGNELWSVQWEVWSGLSCTQPVIVGTDRILLSAGYGKGSRLVRLERGPEGIRATRVWQSARFKTRFNEPVVIDGYAYGFDEGRFECIEVATGKRQWKRGRYGYGQLLAVPGHLLVLDEDGVMHLLRVDPERLDEVATFAGLDGDITLNVPALAHGRLLLRNERELVCYDLRAGAP